MRITSLRLHVIHNQNCWPGRARLGPLPVDYDRPLFDDTVVPYHNWACVSEDDDFWMYDRACVPVEYKSQSTPEVNAVLVSP